MRKKRKFARPVLPKNRETPLESGIKNVSAPMQERLRTPVFGHTSFAGDGELQPIPYTAGSWLERWGQEYGLGWVSREIATALHLNAKVRQGTTLFKNAVLGRQLRFIPCYPPSHPKHDAAWDMADFFNTGIRRVKGSFYRQAWQLVDAPFNGGHKVAAIQTRVEQDGIYKNLWCWDNFDIWPTNQGYQFMADQYGRFSAVRIYDPNSKDVWRDIDVRKFLIYTFRPMNDNPYGTIVLDALAEDLYKFTQSNPELIALLTQYGRPGLYVIAPKMEVGVPEQRIQVFEADGRPAKNSDGTDMYLSSLQYNALVIQHYKAGDIVNLSGGSLIGLLQATPGGEQLFRFIEENFGRNVMSVILGTDQLTESSRVVSEGNAGSSENVMNYGILDARRTFEEMMEGAAGTLIELNWGRGALDLLPIADIGSMSNPRMVSQMNAFNSYVLAGGADIDENYWYRASIGAPLPRKGVAKAVDLVQGIGGNQNNKSNSGGSSG